MTSYSMLCFDRAVSPERSFAARLLLSRAVAQDRVDPNIYRGEGLIQQGL